MVGCWSGGMDMEKKPLLVVAVGGNAIIREKQRGTQWEQLANIEVCCEGLIELLAMGYRLVITHGNGPQVGNNLLRGKCAHHVLPPMMLDVYGAETQGQLGYMLQRVLNNKLGERGISAKVVTLITQVLVDGQDPAFKNPSKPIGPFYTREEFENMSEGEKANYVEDSGRGYRRVVPSPKPHRVVEYQTIRELVEGGKIVIAVGGGGIPVVKGQDGKYYGVEAVIDKDLAAAVLAREIGADYLLILTNVEGVAINFGKDNMTYIAKMSTTEARQYMKEGHFPPGSMGPKLEAAIDFVEFNGGKAFITSLEKAGLALAGKSGTIVYK